MLLASGLLTDSGRVNYGTLAFSGLCVLARGGSVDAFMAAARLIPAIIEKRIGEQIAKGEDESGLVEVAAFRELLTVTEWAEMLSPELTN
jgi:hypothetical protein